MRRAIFFILIILISTSAFAIVSHNSTEVTPGSFQSGEYYFPNGNVGIGTTSPSSTLHVYGNSMFGGLTNDTKFYINYGGTAEKNIAGIRINSGNPVLNSKNGSDMYFNRDVSSSVYFQNQGTDLMTIKRNGDVGIGTAQPLASLHLRKDTTSQNNLILLHNELNNFSSIAYKGYNWAGSSNDITARIDFGSMYSGSDDGDIVFLTAADINAGGILSEKMIIKYNGNVGIGTVNPSSKLDITAATNTNAVFIREDTDDSITHNMYIDGSDNGQFIMYADGESAKVGLSTTGNSYFNGGNVGIGTTTPSHELHVVGDVNVTGTIHGAVKAYLSPWRINSDSNSAYYHDISSRSTTESTVGMIAPANGNLKYMYVNVLSNTVKEYKKVLLNNLNRSKSCCITGASCSTIFFKCNSIST